MGRGEAGARAGGHRPKRVPVVRLLTGASQMPKGGHTAKHPCHIRANETTIRAVSPLRQPSVRRAWEAARSARQECIRQRGLLRQNRLHRNGEAPHREWAHRVKGESRPVSLLAANGASVLKACETIHPILVQALLEIRVLRRIGKRAGRRMQDGARFRPSGAATFRSMRLLTLLQE